MGFCVVYYFRDAGRSGYNIHVENFLAEVGGNRFMVAQLIAVARYVYGSRVH